MAIDILNLAPTTISKNLKGKYILLYGSPKVGKTTLATEFPKSLLLAFEPGYNGLVNKMVQPITKWADFRDVIKQLRKSEAQEMFDTIVIDTCDIAWDYCDKWICMQNPITDKSTGMEIIPKNVVDIPWGKGYQMLTKEYDGAFREIAGLGYGLVFISHEQAKKPFGADKDEIVKITPSLNDRARLVINRFVDIIGYLRRVTNKETNEERRFIYTRDSDLFEAGSRFSQLEPKIEMSYEGLVQAIYDAIDKEISIRGGKVTEEFVNNYEDTKKRSFEEVIAEAKEVWMANKEKDEQSCKKMNSIIETIFGKPMKISEALPAQQDLVEEVISDWKKI